MTGLNDIRTAFLKYFENNGHRIMPSGPLVPTSDPSLLFTNSGMVQFKNVFTGAEKPATPRAVTAQKCVRAGGKHNDLDNVGYTARHHTFFEMLGNFSFGDYFKDDAIALAWRLVTGEFGLDPKRLIVTVFTEDDQAHRIWKKVSGLPDSRILRISSQDNFWSMGDTGPCGPCSEIFFDHGDRLSGGLPGSADEDGDRFIEIWNLVFMQYEQRGPGNRIDLPSPSIDTGMGLERMAAVLQGTHDNYATDLMRSLIMASASVSGTDPDGDHAVSHRVIADHLRASGFLIADGVLPSNEGRGYVLRRIMRRAMRHAFLLGVKEPLMWRLVPALVSGMGGAWSELRRAEPLMTETLKFEESRFRKTLSRGLKLLEEAVGKLSSGAVLPGEVAFRLYDTYGFPLDLTQDALRSRGIGVDADGFEAAMSRQRETAAASWAGSGDQADDGLWRAVREESGASEFLGYETEQAEGRVVAIVSGDARVAEAKKGSEVWVAVNQTPFYGESGGQVGDRGTLTGSNMSMAVRDTLRKAGDVIVHRGIVESGVLKEGDAVMLQVDGARRTGARANHSATHLLHEALRRVLGAHVTQKGSLVESDRLRFDFSHSGPLSGEEIAQVESMVNGQILSNGAVRTRVMTPDEAMEQGALALFGEKYGDDVRVLFMGRPDQVDDDDGGEGEGRAGWSVEFCGGTHVSRLGDIGVFTMAGQSAVGSGVRRVEALTGEAARQYLLSRSAMGEAAAALLKVPLEKAPDRVKALLEDRRRLEKELEQVRTAAAETVAESIDSGMMIRHGVTEGVGPKELRNIMDGFKRQTDSGVVILAGVRDGKANLVVGMTKDLTKVLDARVLAVIGAAALGGTGGGGRIDMAQAGGPNASCAKAAVAAMREAIITERLFNWPFRGSEGRKALALNDATVKSASDSVGSNVRIVSRVLKGVGPKELRKVADDFKQKLGSGVVLLVGVNDGKASVVVGVTEDLTARFDSGGLALIGGAVLDGKGGGGQIGIGWAGEGPNTSHAEAALAVMEKVVRVDLFFNSRFRNALRT